MRRRVDLLAAELFDRSSGLVTIGEGGPGTTSWPTLPTVGRLAIGPDYLTLTHGTMPTSSLLANEAITVARHRETLSPAPTRQPQAARALSSGCLSLGLTAGGVVIHKGSTESPDEPELIDERATGIVLDLMPSAGGHDVLSPDCDPRAIALVTLRFAAHLVPDSPLRVAMNSAHANLSWAK